MEIRLDKTEIARAFYESRRIASGSFAALTGVLSAFVFATIVLVLDSSQIAENDHTNIVFGLSLTSFFVLLISTFLFIACHVCQRVESFGAIYFLAQCLFGIGGADLFVMMPYLLEGTNRSNDLVIFARVLAITSLVLAFLQLKRSWEDSESIAQGEKRPGGLCFTAIAIALLLSAAVALVECLSGPESEVVLVSQYGAVGFCFSSMTVSGFILRWDLEKIAESAVRRPDKWPKAASVLFLSGAYFVLFSLFLLIVFRS